MTRFGPDHVVITAISGQAASNASKLGGQTLFSEFGMGKMDDSYTFRTSLPNVLDLVLGNRSAVQRIRQTRVLVIEEAGMVGARLLDLLDQLLRLVRGRPHDLFGGVMLVLVLDPMQNRPFTHVAGIHAPSGKPKSDPQLPLCFAHCFPKAFPPTGWHRLITPHRQTDPAQLRELKLVRYGLVTGAMLYRMVTQVRLPVSSVCVCVCVCGNSHQHLCIVAVGNGPH
jgi:hypothetical protein